MVKLFLPVFSDSDLFYMMLEDFVVLTNCSAVSSNNVGYNDMTL